MATRKPKTDEVLAPTGTEAAPAKKPRKAAAKPAADVAPAAEAAPKRTRKPKAEAAPAAAPVELSPEERYRRIAEAAYYIAEKRGFAEGNHQEDWLQAEAEVNAALAG